MTIAEVGRKYDLTTDTIRYYKRIGLIPTISRTEHGIRNYFRKKERLYRNNIKQYLESEDGL